MGYCVDEFFEKLKHLDEVEKESECPCEDCNVEEEYEITDGVDISLTVDQDGSFTMSVDNVEDEPLKIGQTLAAMVACAKTMLKGE